MKTFAPVLIVLIACTISFTAFAQVGINNISPKALLDITVADPADPEPTDGILIPRLTSFPTIDPTLDQHGMLIYMNNAAAFAGKGYYYWNNDNNAWQPIGEKLWGKAKNANTDDIMYAMDANGTNPVVIKDSDGFTGIGTDTPESELHIYSRRNGPVNTIIELTVESFDDEVEILLRPGGPNSPEYTLVANSNATEGFMIYEDNNEQLQLKAGGELRLEDLRSTKNPGIEYPASVYVEADGTLKTTSSYSILDDLKVNATNFATESFAETDVAGETVFTAALYTYAVTPTQDLLLEISYHLSARFSDYNTTNTNIDGRHNTKMYGTLVRLDGVDYTFKSSPFIGNNGLHGTFFPSDQLFIPLIADGSTYTITIHGYVQNDWEDGDEPPEVGIRGTFGGDPRDRMQILHHY